MRFLLSVVSCALLLASCAGSNRGRDERRAPFAINPSAVIAEEIAFSRLAQEKGQWTAFRETAADDAVMFVPEPINAQAWLKGRADPPKAVSWQPHSVYMSCDGKTGITTGAWQRPDGTQGYFTTVWHYFEKPGGDGKWMWVLDHGDALDTPREAPDFLSTKIASCKGSPTARVIAPAEGVQMKQGFSRDQSLSWTWQYHADKSRTLSVGYWNGDAWEQAFIDKVKAPGQ